MGLPGLRLFFSLRSLFPATAALLLLPACAPRVAAPLPGAPTARGTASWYGDDFHGRTTSSGVRYNMYGMTAAHKTLPLGCRIRVTRLDNGRSVVVEVNDRGPFVGERIIDLSYEAARRLDMLDTGLATVQVDVLQVPAGAVVDLGSSPAASAPPGSGLRASPPLSPAWWITLGSFSARQNAAWMQAKLASDLPSVEVRPPDPSTGNLYQVRAGPFRSEEEARTGREVLERLGLKGSVAQE